MRKFNIDTVDISDLLKICRQHGFSAINTSLAIHFFVLKTPHKVLADKYFIDEKSVTMRKCRMKKVLTKE